MSNEVHMTPEQLKEWQDFMELKSEEAADLLDLHLNTFLNYRRGYRTMSQGEERDVPIPKSVAISCVALAAGIEDFDDIYSIVEGYPS